MNKAVWIYSCVAFCAALGAVPSVRLAAAQRLSGRDGSEWKPRGPFDVAPLETEVLGQTHWLRGGPAALRVIVTDHNTGKPVRARVRLALAMLPKGTEGPLAAVPLFDGKTNGVGSLDAQFAAPASAPGPYELRVNVDAPMGKDAVTQPVELEQSEQIMLTCDKPVYQPSQVIHLRALALDRANRRAVSGQTLTFEVEDARGNKVFKQPEKLSEFGVASADFTLADEVNMGTYTLRAVLPTGDTEKKVSVERYVLPKFKVAVTTDRPYYLPGETVKGTVQSDYFFGKPVSRAKVAIDVNTIDIGVSKLAELNGTTDAAGTYQFEYRLPNSFVGQPFEQGKAVAQFQARVTDTAEHQELQSKTVPVVKDPVLIAMIPESKQVVPGLANRVYIACATPDGTPLKNASITVSAGPAAPGGSKPNEHLQSGRLQTDSLGMAVFEFVPPAGAVTVTTEARTADGHSGTSSLTLNSTTGPDGILLRTDKTLAKVGDRLVLDARSTEKSGTIYVDVIRNKQTILTRAEPAKNGAVHMTISLTDDMTGTIEVHAYKILPNEQIVRDTRTVVVSPADDLTIRVSADQTQYRPGQDAVLKFSVQDQANRPVSAAVQLAVVDESVFALSELQPGLEKVYFTLERELMEPKYEIHGLKPTDLLLKRRDLELSEPERQRGAALLLATAPAAPEFEFRSNTFQVRYAEMEQRLNTFFQQAQQKIMQAAQKYRKDTGQSLSSEEGAQTLVDRRYLQPRDLLDPWGHSYKYNFFNGKNFESYFGLSSAGPDGKWGTSDDVRGDEYGPWGGFGGRMGGGGGGRGGVMDGKPGPVRMLERRELAEGMRFAAPAGAALPMDRPRALASTAAKLGDVNRSGANKDSGGAQAAEPRVREYFPETMSWNPAIITDGNGKAELRLPVADSITTWRLSMLANSAAGQLGSATAPLKVFQDFFADIDLPVSLTQNDRVDIPVSVYNYLLGDQEVTLTLDKQPWFQLEGPAQQSVHLGKNDVKVVYFPITVIALGRHALMVTAQGSKLSDALRRSIDVTPNGEEKNAAINDRLEKEVEKTVTYPPNAIPGASSLWVKLYPGAFSQVVEGLDGLLRMPNGCFEQTSSTTYPNVLVTGYLKASKKINPELQMKAEQYINVGYQRLVTFECKGGGFSWFGNEPAHQILTAYGLLEFSDMARVHDVDPALVQRTQKWLAGRQKGDGTWPEDSGGIAEGIINRQTGALRSAAYIAWALAESGYQGPEIARSVAYVKEHRGESKDPYTLAVILNLLTKVEPEGETTANVANALIETARQNGKAAWWEGGGQTFTGARRESADLETTGLAAYGLAKWGRNGGFVNKVLTYLVQAKDSYGTWQTTQGTVWSMKALLFASAHGTGGGSGSVTVWANGVKASTIKITAEDSDVMRQIDLRAQLRPDRNNVKLTYEGEGSLLYQIASRYYTPWEGMRTENPGPLTIAVRYDKTTLAQNDTAQVKVTVTNTTNKTAEMPLIDLGVPPGFTVVPDELNAAVQKKTITKYTLAARQIIVYMEKLDPAGSVVLNYAVKASYPIKARTPLSRVYPYYNPEQVSISPPQTVVVRK